MGDIINSIVEKVQSWVTAFIDYVFFGIFYLVEVILVFFVKLVESVMKIFTGEAEVVYGKQHGPLINLFFSHESVRGVYSAIGLIGIVFAFGFAIWAVIKKVLDLRGKQQGVTLGSIVGNLIKSILLIFSMNAIMMVALYSTSTLLDAVSVAIENGGNFGYGGSDIVFTEEQFAAMGRIINTLGNYSLNPSYRSRYNLNACYNDIRQDLQFLGDQGIFRFHYSSDDGKPTWQSLMEELATAYDYTRDVTLDSYDDGLTNAILECMDAFKANPNIEALPKYEREKNLKAATTVPLDRIIFLSGTMGTVGGLAGARNDAFNKKPSFYDNARLPFFIGEKSIYDYEVVRETFNPSPWNTNYILVYVVALAMIREMIILIITCSVRIFNLLTLYVASPLAIATYPLDDGGKFKQWTTAFVVQLLSVVGMVISLRMFFVFLPIIWSPELVAGGNGLATIVVKAILTYGAMEAVNKINGVFTGILADNAGYQAITASSMRDDFNRSSVGQALGKATAGSLAGKGLKMGINKLRGKNADGSKKEETPVEKQKKERQRQNKMKSLKANIDHASKTGKLLNGATCFKGELDMMKRTYSHMDAGNSYDDAVAMANIDRKWDDKDKDTDTDIKQMQLRNPPPAPTAGGEGSGPESQNNLKNDFTSGGEGEGAPTPGSNPGPAKPGTPPGGLGSVNPNNSIQGQQNLNNRTPGNS